jgi:hypothetical protein
MPVGVVAGQSAHLQAQHNPGPPEGDLRDQPLEAIPSGGGRAGGALIAVDHGDLLVRPAQRDGPAAQGVLPLRGLGVVDDLLE